MARTNRMLAATLTLLVGQTVGAAKTANFLEDDYDAARAEATRRKVPMLVEVWAPW